MILYFTGTGNSEYAAKKLAAALGEETTPLMERIRHGDTSPLESQTPWIVCTPTYAWQIPHIVRDHLRATLLRGSREVYFVMTCGSEIGDADRYNRRLCQEKDLACMGTAQIVMPENYIAMFNAPQAEEARQIVARAEPDIDRAIAAVRDSSAFPPPRDNLYDRFMSGPVNPIFYACIVNSRAFTVGDACTGCGQCARRCPTNSIAIRDGRPVWGEGCTHCMACICYCPAKAIEYGKKSLGKPRYHFEAL